MKELLIGRRLTFLLLSELAIEAGIDRLSIEGLLLQAIARRMWTQLVC